MLKHHWLLAVATIASLSACPAFAAGLTTASLNNATVDVADMTGDGTHNITFTDGVHNNGEGTDKILLTAIGDLNGDGLDDGAIVFYENWGGTGAFMNMAVFLCKDNEPNQIDIRTLGDRSRTNSLRIKNRVLTLDIMTHGPSDPASMPSVHKIIRFRVKGQKLFGPGDINRP